ncbi:MAG: signal peptidase I [Caldilineaceae bacterium]|nr:signal peptidase I [Caldilineaceae bacterium]HRJ43966.1 signal peptidase I [Caldilineaceae bacterium]
MPIPAAPAPPALPALNTPEEKAQPGFWLGTLVKEVLQVVVPAVLLALSIHIFLAQATVVYGQSMQPNLQPAERLVIEKVSYYFDLPQRGDIVVLDMPQMSELLIKRVVGLPGESVEIRRGVVLIDGQVIEQPFVLLPGGTTYGPITLGSDSYFMMGDNRNNSNDSRAFGPVSRSAIAGKAWLRYWPLNRFTLFH